MNRGDRLSPAILNITTTGSVSLARVNFHLPSCILIVCALFLGGGVAIGRFLASPLAFRLFNLFMGGLTLGSVALLFL